MLSSLFYSALADSFYYPTPARTIYVVSDSQLEEMKRKQNQEELDSVQSQIKILNEREGELKKELKALTAAK